MFSRSLLVQLLLAAFILLLSEMSAQAKPVDGSQAALVVRTRHELRFARNPPPKGEDDTPIWAFGADAPNPVVVGGRVIAYAFDVPEGGYITVTANDRLSPILYYSLESSLTVAVVPPAQAMIEAFADEVEQLEDKGSGVPDDADPSWDLPAPEKSQRLLGLALSQTLSPPAGPLFTTARRERQPYMDGSPTYDEERCWAGCVPMAMAAMMRYQQCPTAGMGSQCYQWSFGQKNLCIDFGSTTYDWANMPGKASSASPQAVKDAVGTSQTVSDAKNLAVIGVRPHYVRTTYYVNGAAGDDKRDSKAPVHTGGRNGPKKTIQAAIFATGPNDTVIVADGFCWYPKPTIANCVIAANAASQVGGGLASCDGGISNSIISRNATRFGPQLHESSVPAYSCVEGGVKASEKTISAAPRFTADGCHLEADSHCIDAGRNEDWMRQASDLDGNPRIFKGTSSLTVHMGAYEFGCFHFRLTRVPKLPGGALELTWNRHPGDTYTIWSCNDLSEGNWVNEATVSFQGKSTTWIAPDNGHNWRFYRIEMK